MIDYLRGLLRRHMYRDVMTIKRAILVEGVVDRFLWQTVSEDVPCHLVQYGKQLAAHRDDRAQHLTTDLRVDCEPEVEILANDHLIITHAGKVWELVAGEAFDYPTHKETSCRRRKEAGQA